MLITLCVWLLFFFFFKQKTAYELRISDWSSDVCSSDLRDGAARRMRPARERLDPDELVRRDGILRLEGDPDVAAGQRVFKLRVEAELPAGVFFLARSIFGPQRPRADRAFGGDERGGEAPRV